MSPRKNILCPPPRVQIWLRHCSQQLFLNARVGVKCPLSPPYCRHIRTPPKIPRPPCGSVNRKPWVRPWNPHVFIKFWRGASALFTPCRRPCPHGKTSCAPHRVQIWLRHCSQQLFLNTRVGVKCPLSPPYCRHWRTPPKIPRPPCRSVDRKPWVRPWNPHVFLLNFGGGQVPYLSPAGAHVPPIPHHVKPLQATYKIFS